MQQVKEMNATDLFLTQGFRDQPFLLPNMTNITKLGKKGQVGYYYCNSTQASELPSLPELPSLCRKSPLSLIKFHVVYVQGNDMLPWGEIQFNYATVDHVSIANKHHKEFWNSEQGFQKLHTYVSEIEDNKTRNDKPAKDEIYKPIGGYTGEPEIEVILKPEEQLPLTYISGLPVRGNLSEGGCSASTKQLESGWNLWFLTVSVDSNQHVYVSSPWPASCTTPYPRYNPDISVC